MMFRVDYVAFIQDKKYLRIVLGKPDGERPLGRPANSWVHCGESLNKCCV